MNRLEIAARILSGFAANPQVCGRDDIIPYALQLADDLLREAEEPDEPTEKPVGPEPSAEALKFVAWFLKLLKDTDAPEVKITDATERRWAQTYDLMIGRDKRTKEQVVAVCKWARNDPFWQNNFFSPSKLRHKKDGVMWFDMFLARVAPGSGGTAPTGPNIYKEPDGWRELAAKKWPDMNIPASWADLPASLRNDLLK